MKERSTTDPLDEALERVLATAPDVRVPEDFAARVAAALPPPVPAPRAHWGRTAALLSAAVLVLFMFVLVPHMESGSRVTHLLELVFSTELVVLALLSARWDRLLGWPS